MKALIKGSLERWARPLLLIGSCVWVISWLVNRYTEDGTVAVLGLSERGWRRLLDPGTLFLMFGLLGVRLEKDRSHGSLDAIGFWTTEVGLALALTGNVIEFWVGEMLYVDVPGEFEPSDHFGWALFLAGTAVAILGFLLVGLGLLRRRMRLLSR